MEKSEKREKISEEGNSLRDALFDLVEMYVEKKVLNPAQVAYILAREASSIIHVCINDGLDDREYTVTQHRSMGILLDAIIEGRLDDKRTRDEVMESCEEKSERENEEQVEE